MREAIKGVMNTRASNGEIGIRQMLQDDGELTPRLYQHQLIYSLFTGDYQPEPKRIVKLRGFGHWVAP